MGLFTTPFPSGPKPAPRTLRALARLLGYPDAELRAHLPQIREVLHAEGALPAARLVELDALIAYLQGLGIANEPPPAATAAATTASITGNAP